ncbi:MAG TPA: glycoside hydrolase 100 family protein [Steroidobacteraceae bacterium]|nr:glycoside hydrolase 100 family protein [Steroidobacteraceae bacterium]
MLKLTGAVDGEALIAACHAKSIDLLRRNMTPAGILAASPGERARSRGYTAIFGRDAAICALGMALSGDARLERAAAVGLETLGEHQAPNGQIPKFVQAAPLVSKARKRGSAQAQEADFWYLGCIDSTLWWLLALDFLERRRSPLHDSPARRQNRRSDFGRRLPAREGSAQGRSRATRSRRVDLALQWLLAQEHQRFFLLQQNEASDWADIMPRSGFVLYTNALWYAVKRRYGLDRAAETRANLNSLFHPFSAGLAKYRRARLLNEYVLRGARNRDLYLSFVNFSFFGDEGDVFGNVLAVLCGLTDPSAGRRTLDALQRARASRLYPVRAVTHPIRRRSALWRPYMARHRQNEVWQYHNGGIWPMVGGFWVIALAAAGRLSQARLELVNLARACAVRNWAFTEWLHGTTAAPRGMPGQSWNAAAFLMAEHAVAEKRNVLLD